MKIPSAGVLILEYVFVASGFIDAPVCLYCAFCSAEVVSAGAAFIGKEVDADLVSPTIGLVSRGIIRNGAVIHAAAA